MTRHCTNCQEPGHHKDRCTSPARPRTCECGRQVETMVQGMACFRCRSAKRRPKRGYPSFKTCGYCGGKFHNTRGCRLRREHASVGEERGL